MEKRSEVFESSRLKIQESLIKLNEQINEQMKPVHEALKNIQLTTSELFKSIDYSVLIEKFQQFREVVVEYGSKAEKFKTYVVEMGYPPHYDLLPYEVTRIVELYEEDQEKAITYTNDFMLKKFDHDNLQMMLEKWGNAKWTENRVEIFTDIMNAHKNKMYYVSIPATIAQIEGIIAQGFDHYGKMNGNHIKEYLTRLLSEVGRFSFDEGIKAFYFKNVLASFEHGKPIRSFLSRNAILHGADVGYGTPENSLKCILLFDYIHDKISEHIAQS